VTAPKLPNGKALSARDLTFDPTPETDNEDPSYGPRPTLRPGADRPSRLDEEWESDPRGCRVLAARPRAAIFAEPLDARQGDLAPAADNMASPRADRQIEATAMTNFERSSPRKGSSTDQPVMIGGRHDWLSCRPVCFSALHGRCCIADRSV